MRPQGAMRAKPADAEINRENRPSFNVSSAAEGARGLAYRASVARMSESDITRRANLRTAQTWAYRRSDRPGECFTLGLLARQFGTSITPVRDALSQLAVADALYHSRQSGVVAPVLSCSDLDELLRLRLADEGFAFASVLPRHRVADWRGFKVLHADLSGWRNWTIPRGLLLPCGRCDGLLGVARSGVLSMLPDRIWCRFGPTFTQMAADIAQRRRISYLLGTVVTAIGRRDLEQARKALVDEIVAGTLPCGGAAEPSAPPSVPSDTSACHEATNPSQKRSGRC